jgi:nicotinamidase/pyrazinamidase
MPGLTFPNTDDALLVVDLQNDFCDRGNLPVPGGSEIVPIVNRLCAGFSHVIVTQDWHPTGHLSFASAHPGKRPFEIIRTSYGEQTLWPDHCVQETPGAQFHPALRVPHAELVLRKGFRREIDSYSAFFENDRRTPTGLSGYLRDRAFRRLAIVGLAFDFCVRWSAEDARSLGFEVAVFEDACRGINVGSSMATAQTALRRCGVELLRSGSP